MPSPRLARGMPKAAIDGTTEAEPPYQMNTDKNVLLYSLCNGFAELRWRTAKFRLEAPVEGGPGVKSADKTQIVDGGAQRCILQLGRCVFYAQMVDKGIISLTEFLFQERRNIVYRNSKLLTEFFFVEFCIQVGFGIDKLL